MTVVCTKINLGWKGLIHNYEFESQQDVQPEEGIFTYSMDVTWLIHTVLLLAQYMFMTITLKLVGPVAQSV